MQSQDGKMSMTSDEINFLVFRYLQESGAWGKLSPLLFLRLALVVGFCLRVSTQTRDKVYARA